MTADLSADARGRRRTGVLGGTFDPFHCGHEAAALAAQRALSLEHVVLVPSRQPPHRSTRPLAFAADRLAMAQIAASAHNSWSVSDTELKRTGPSYSFDTLAEFGAQGLTPSEIFFITGADAFAEIATWSRYPSVLDLAHFAVIARAGITLDSIGNRLPSLAGRLTTPALFSGSERTRIILIDATTPAVSSTEVRRRVQYGESITGMVPSAVETYIRDHRLYYTPKSGVGR
jgi:nicotinate-nucleotide adenylyltransferase